MDQPPHSFDRIAPAPVQLGANRDAAAAAARPGAIHPGRLPLAVLAVLLCMALGVIFLLPRWQQATHPAGPAPASPAAAGVATNAATPAAASRAAPAEPATDAERQQARSDAQDLLERLRELDRVLTGMGVGTWAAADYQRALDQLAAGEHAYQTLDFTAARATWQAALGQFEALVKKADTVFAESVARGTQALNEGRGDDAVAAFRTALQIRPDDAGAARGAERAAHIGQVMELMRQGEERFRAGDLAAAAATFQQARERDPDFAPAQERLQSVRRELGAQAYRAAMSAGFAALAAGQPGAARGHFNEALRLQPGAPEAVDALRQAGTQLTSAEIEQRLANARAAEQTEDWGRAVTEYDAALKLDPNLLAATAGISTAAARRDLDQQLARAIAQPERLADDSVDEETTALLAEAGRVPAPGSKLKQQIAVLSALRQEARTPVPVTLISDGNTEVTVYRVSRIGRFTSKEMSLRPGRYVATGTRAGYRDVRVEFSVAATGAATPVQVQCTQPIGAGN